jgi:hypothetical protein
VILSCDPGQSGGIAWSFNGKTYAAKMPATPKDIFLFLRKRATEADGFESCICYLERVGGYVSGNSGPAAAKFAKHCGHLEMALLALKISYIEVLPNRWITYFIGKQSYPKTMTIGQRKTLRKNKIKAKAQALYPDIKVTLAISDALGLLCYAEQTDLNS